MIRFRGILRKTGPAGFVIYNMKPELQDLVINRPAGPTDGTKVPHYCGPFPNWANTSIFQDIEKNN